MGRSVLYVAAMDAELRPLRKKLRAKRTTVGGLQAFESAQRGTAVVAATIGVGPAMARKRSERLVEAVRPDLVVMSGIAGGVDQALPVGTVVCPAVVIDLDTGVEHVPVPIPGHPGDGVLATSGRLVLDDERLEELRRRKVRAIDMESAAVAGVCQAHGTNFCVVRVISYRPSDGLVDDSVFHLLAEDGTTDALAVLRFVLRHPRRLPRLIRLAKDSSAAAVSAAEMALRAR
jgi:adenosylhomocysteine nucleosidase